MEVDTYVVAPSEGRWTLRLGNRSLGVFGDLDAARRAARVAGRMSRRRGHKVEILVYDGKEEAPATLIERLTCGTLLLACSSIGSAWHLPATLLQLVR